jgi:hypothetical protein
VIALAVGAALSDPALVPGPGALYFHSHRSLALFSLFLFNLLTLFLHEMGHLIGARAVGVPARLGIGHRLWILVAETDLTGLWAVPPKRRYLPLLAGPFIDLLSLSFLVLAFWAQKHGRIDVPPLVLGFARAAAFSYILRLLWQCFFFVRTDFYYVLIVRLGSMNLMRNTEVYLRSRLARILPWIRPVAAEPIPPREEQAVRFYTPFYLAGRLLAFWSLLFITLPLIGRYLIAMGESLGEGFSRDPLRFVDSLLLAALLLGPSLAGLYLWLRSSSRGLFSRWRSAQ